MVGEQARKDMRPGFRFLAGCLALATAWLAVRQFTGDRALGPVDEGRFGQLALGVNWLVWTVVFGWPALSGRAILPGHRRVLGRRKAP